MARINHQFARASSTAETRPSPVLQQPTQRGPQGTAEVRAGQPSKAAMALVEAGGKTKPTDPLAAMQNARTAGAVRLRSCRAANTKLPSETAAKAVIERHLPKIADAVVLHTGGELTVNDASCETAAGLTLGKLRQLGLDARLNDAGGHITVRVRTGGDELIVDPTLMQFFTDGSATDRALCDTGGFVGTEAELKALIRDEIESWDYNGDDLNPGKQAVQKDLSTDQKVRDEILDQDIDAMIMTRLFTRHRPSGLFKDAQMLSRRLEAHGRGNAAAASSDDERAAFELLRSE